MAARNDKKINCCNGNTKYCERNSAMTSDLSATGNFHKISTFANVCEGRKMGHIVYHMCIAAVLFVGGTYASQPSETQPSDMQTIPLLWSLSPAYLQSLRVGMDQETLNYLLPRLSAKYKPNNSWSDIADPRFYVLSELGTQEYDKQDSSNIMPKRNSLRSNGHTLSIVQPLDVLRQRMLLEIARRKVLEQAQKVEENRAYLKTIGKRSVDRQSLHQYQSL